VAIKRCILRVEQHRSLDRVDGICGTFGLNIEGAEQMPRIGGVWGFCDELPVKRLGQRQVARAVLCECRAQ
jgi:hypothetical protein